jgi:hypothetical protein
VFGHGRRGGRLRAVDRLGTVPQVLAGVTPIDDPRVQTELAVEQRVNGFSGEALKTRFIELKPTLKGLFDGALCEVAKLPKKA